MVLFNKTLYDYCLSALNAYLVFLQRNDYRQKNDFPNHLLLRPFSLILKYSVYLSIKTMGTIRQRLVTLTRTS